MARQSRKHRWSYAEDRRLLELAALTAGDGPYPERTAKGHANIHVR